MSADLLREAAALLQGPSSPLPHGVGLALADWLDALAAGWPWDDEDGVVDPDGDPLTLDESVDSYALAVARAILGRQS